ncbi:MAG: hypothetical protein J5546_08460 [Lachnospiraceae bacterium]|nr:hypothetical protein [Lachnospiraceae bacterium]
MDILNKDNENIKNTNLSDSNLEDLILSGAKLDDEQIDNVAGGYMGPGSRNPVPIIPSFPMKMTASGIECFRDRCSSEGGSHIKATHGGNGAYSNPEESN